MPLIRDESGHRRKGFAEELEHSAVPNSRDRDLQDHVIRYLTDASLRSCSSAADYLEGSDAERAKRFSHFLTRRYYRDRLHRGFRYSARLLDSEHVAASLVDTPAFDQILERCVLGSLATANAAGDLALSRLIEKRSEEWWPELLQYEWAFFIQVATSEPTPVSSSLQRSLSTLVREFEFAIPEILGKLKQGEIPDTARHLPTTLLFSRTHHGRIYVVEIDAIAGAVISAVNGSRQLAKIAQCAGISEEETKRVLDDLVRINAVVSPFTEAA